MKEIKISEDSYEALEKLRLDNKTIDDVIASLIRICDSLKDIDWDEFELARTLSENIDGDYEIIIDKTLGRVYRKKKMTDGEHVKLRISPVGTLHRAED